MGNELGKPVIPGRNTPCEHPKWVKLASILLILVIMETFSDLINSDKPVLVDFYADWCGPCKTMSPVIQEVARATQGQARVVKVDIDKSTQAAEAYGIQAVPTFIIFRNGNIVWRHSGIIDKNSLVNRLLQNSWALAPDQFNSQDDQADQENKNADPVDAMHITHPFAFGAVGIFFPEV